MTEDQENLNVPQESQTEEIVSLFFYLRKLLKNPIDTIKEIPKIRFSSLIIFQAIICTLSMVVSNLISPYAIQPITVVLSIVSSFFALSIFALGIHYFFYFLIHRDLGFRSLYTLVLMSWIPFAVLHFFYYYFSFVHVVGIGLSLIMMATGLNENFQVPRRNSLNISYTLFVLFTIIWGFNQFQSIEKEQSMAPVSLDEMERRIHTTQ